MNSQYKKMLQSAGISILGPVLSLTVFYLIRFTELSIGEYLTTLDNIGGAVSVISLGLIPGVIWYFTLVNKGKYRQGQGVMLSILIWVLVILYLEFL